MPCLRWLWFDAWNSQQMNHFQIQCTQGETAPGCFFPPNRTNYTLKDDDDAVETASVKQTQLNYGLD